jgi:carbonic anhydrase
MQHTLLLVAVFSLSGCSPAPGEARAEPAPRPAKSKTLKRQAAKLRVPAAPAAAHPAAAAGHATHASKVDPKKTLVAAAGLLQLILRDNSEYVRKHRKTHFIKFEKGQHPRATVIGCSDSRFHIQALDSNPDDELFVIRNIGNNVRANAGSIDYGIRHLHTPVLLIVGHVGCGAVKAAMGDYDAEPAVIQRELDGLHLSLMRTAAVGTFAQRWLANVFGNVHQQVRYALADYRRLVTSGALYIVGAVYDFRNELGKGYGRLHVVNVNGERDRSKLAKMPLLAGMKAD